jgi:primosomal protein N'
MTDHHATNISDAELVGRIHQGRKRPTGWMCHYCAGDATEPRGRCPHCYGSRWEPLYHYGQETRR